MIKITTNMYSFLLILFCFVSCQNSYESGDSRLKVTNRKTSPIAIELSEDTIPSNLGLVDYYLRKQIKFYDTISFTGGIGGKNYWSNFISTSKNERLNIFIYDVDTLIKYMDMEYIRNNRLWVKKMQLSEAELDSMKWVIVYE